MNIALRQAMRFSAPVRLAYEGIICGCLQVLFFTWQDYFWRAWCAAGWRCAAHCAPSRKIDATGANRALGGGWDWERCHWIVCWSAGRTAALAGPLAWVVVFLAFCALRLYCSSTIHKTGHADEVASAKPRIRPDDSARQT